MRAPSPSLRSRITDDLMNDIIEIMKPENQRPGCVEDPRRDIIDAIRWIAEFEEPLTLGAQRDTYGKIATLTKELRNAVKRTEYADRGDALDRWSRDASQKADEIGRVPRSGGASTARKDYTARVAFDLLDLHGGVTATLTADGPYVTLANRLYEAATGVEFELVAACTKHIRDLREIYLEAELPWPHPRRGRRRAPMPDGEPNEVERMMQADADQHSARVLEAIRSKRLSDLLDEMGVT